MANITSAKQNNVITIRSNWIDNTTKLRSFYDVIITLPDKYYTIATLLAYLNLNQTPPSGDSVNIYTLGIPGNQLYPGFRVDDRYSPAIAFQYASNLTQAGVSLATNTHVYESFELIVNSNTLNLQKVLGFQLGTNQKASTNSLIIFCYATQSNADTVYSIQSSSGTSDGSLLAPGLYNMNTITSLSISLENSISQNRNTYYNLTKTDFMYRVPVDVGFGELITWSATLDAPSYQSNFILTEVHITVADEEGVDVNFQGTPWNADIIIQFAENADVPSNSPSDLNMHTMNQKTYDPETVMQGATSNYDRLFPGSRGIDNKPRTKRRAFE